MVKKGRFQSLVGFKINWNGESVKNVHLLFNGFNP